MVRFPIFWITEFLVVRISHMFFDTKVLWPWLGSKMCNVRIIKINRDFDMLWTKLSKMVPIVLIDLSGAMRLILIGDIWRGRDLVDSR